MRSSHSASSRPYGRSRKWNTRAGVSLLLSVALLAACAPDAGRDVVPMSLPGAGTTVAADTVILPLEEVRKSQAALVSQRVANTDITVTYSRPVARGRAVFGALIPYGETWNPGADQATSVTFWRNVRLAGQPLPAGSYTIWCIPAAETWHVIISRATDVYHTPYPGTALDAIRFDVATRAVAHTEMLTFDFPVVEANRLNCSCGGRPQPCTLQLRCPEKGAARHTPLPAHRRTYHRPCLRNTDA